jgi:hypothetical protein
VNEKTKGAIPDAWNCLFHTDGQQVVNSLPAKQRRDSQNDIEVNFSASGGSVTSVIFLRQQIPTRSARRDAESCIRSQKSFAGNFRGSPKGNLLHHVEPLAITELQLS